MLEIPIAERSRKYGYIYWPRTLDASVQNFFGDRKDVELIFGEYPVGEKKIDWKYRRISVGWSKTRKISQDASVFQLQFKSNGKVEVKCL